MLRIHNSLTGQVEPFVPLVPGKVRLYVCGITVYDYCHIGHMRMFVVFDVVRRYLRHCGYSLTFVRNITDIDDKIIRRAAENGEPIEALTARYIAAMDEDAAQLDVERPDIEPRATAYVPEILAMIQRLIERGHAYVASSGDVLYSVSSFPDYGRLSGKRLADLRAGARVDVEESKHDPLDFVLWKRSKPGEPTWDSPWGPGRPGWHIECSAMSTSLLGDYFDIHGGGMDLKFPHHENEIAQSCGATGHPFVKVWMHNGFVNVDNEKMSKSLGNFFTVRDILPRLRHPEVLRYFLLGSHYRGPINYSLTQLEQADLALGRLYNALRGLPEASAPTVATPYREKFEAAMSGRGAGGAADARARDQHAEGCGQAGRGGQLGSRIPFAVRLAGRGAARSRGLVPLQPAGGRRGGRRGERCADPGVHRGAAGSAQGKGFCRVRPPARRARRAGGGAGRQAGWRDQLAAQVAPPLRRPIRPSGPRRPVPA